MSAQEVYNEFVKTRYHRGPPQLFKYRAPKATYCVVEFDGRIVGDVQLFIKTSPTVHAEDNMIAELERRISGYDLIYGCIEILVYINYSPCGRCSEKLEQFIRLNNTISFFIVAVFPYKVSRPSCEEPWADCPFLTCRPPAVAVANEIGLKRFNQTPQLQL